MKKLIIVAALIISSAVFTGCGNQNSDNNGNNANLANTDINTVSEVDDEEEESSLPDKTSFEKIPDEAVESFDFMVESTKKIYIQETSKRLYGYVGSDIVNGIECYIFELYDVEEKVNEKVASVAVTKNAEKIYVFDEITQKYTELKIPEDSSSLTESQWCDEVTASFAEYLSDEDSEKSVSDTDEKVDN
ncbi:MAG: hypothetical protein ACI4I6_05015 [Hominimerdicola sp.]